MIHVTKTFLPPIEEYIEYMKGIWERNRVTNNGPLLRKLEEKLQEYLGVKNLLFVSNGTIALQIALRALSLKGEVITSPFSYVATTSSIFWEGCQPVFVDIDPTTLCINPDLIEGAITHRTTAILPTHVYGIPCDVEKIEQIAHKHSLKVIYDAAHAFGVRYQEKSLADYGNASILSFHATKLFHTIEGGAIITEDDDIAHRIRYMRNFGHNGEEEFFGLGINGKNSEFHAAMGLCNLSYVPEIITARKIVSQFYDELLKGSNLTRPILPPGTSYNYAYFPVMFHSEKDLLRAKARLNARKIFPRRYFYPSLNHLPYVKQGYFPVTDRVSPSILCLPLYPDLPKEQIELIVNTIHNQD